ncbi:hypothetical protein ACFQMA_18540 [Halosimplex aquaticum]|uniref:Uncharacterized protein n=1 Tax=Halosimplex aquaticum TaxID=3026162 RepID=A0ABD5Y8X4_9EURY|nr:hypothetical protein [Halosimplex aquaticum]
MSESQFEDELERKIEEIGEKADRAERANDLEAEIRRAKDNIGDLGRELNSLDSSVEGLLFYDGVLTSVFGDDRLDEVDRAVRRVREVSDITDEEVLSAAEDRRTNEILQSVEDAREVVRHARSETIDAIREHQREWEGEIESARDLNQIIGGAGSDFEEVLSDMNAFLNDSIWDEDRTLSSLESRWNNLTDKWEQNAGKHGWDSFQEEHGLSEDAMDILKRFAEEGSVRLNELSVEVIKEMKGVDDLESAIRMEIDTR